MLFGYFSTSIFQDALTGALCECVYLFVCLLVYSCSFFFLIFVCLENDWGYPFARDHKIAFSSLPACDSNDCFNYGSFSGMDAFVCWVQMLVFRRLWSSGRRFQMLDFFHFLLLYYCWYSGTPLRIFFPTTQILDSFMDSYALNYKYHLVYCVLCHWSPNVIRNIFQVRLAHERKELRIYFYSFESAAGDNAENTFVVNLYIYWVYRIPQIV